MNLQIEAEKALKKIGKTLSISECKKYSEAIKRMNESDMWLGFVFSLLKLAGYDDITIMNK